MPPRIRLATPPAKMTRPLNLRDLPREIIRLICKHVYDPMELTQQDRLTWGIYSTVDMHEERQTALLTLKAFGSTCRKVRREARVVLFRCIRTTTLEHVDIALGQGPHFWGRHARCLIVDLSMFDPDADDFPSSPTIPTPSALTTTYRTPRSCWSESARLSALIQSLPALEHVSFFADGSDDSTLALLFASLIQHPSLHRTPPPTMPPSPSLAPTSPTVSSHFTHTQPILTTPITSTPTSSSTHAAGAEEVETAPLASRIRSFGWRQRAAPPRGYKTYSQSSTFVSTLHLIRHAYRLSFLVLDADLDEMDGADVLVVMRELSLRHAPLGEDTELVSLMLCGPIRNWGEAFLRDMVASFSGFKELFFDRPLEKSNSQHRIQEHDFLSLVAPLSRLPHLQLLQIGSYTIPTHTQLRIVQRLSTSHTSLLVIGLMGEEGETHWWGIWRRASARWNAVSSGATSGSGSGCPQPSAYTDDPNDPNTEQGLIAYDHETDIVVAPLEIGHLRTLESDAEKLGAGGRRSSILEHRRFSLIDPIPPAVKGKRRQSAVAPLVPMVPIGPPPMVLGKRQRGEGNGDGLNG